MSKDCKVVLRMIGCGMIGCKDSRELRYAKCEVWFQTKSALKIISEQREAAPYELKLSSFKAFDCHLGTPKELLEVTWTYLEEVLRPKSPQGRWYQFGRKVLEWFWRSNGEHNEIKNRLEALHE